MSNRYIFIDFSNVSEKELNATVNKKSRDGQKRTIEQIFMEKDFFDWRRNVFRSLYQAVANFGATHVIVAGDYGESWRYGLFPTYKSGRDDKKKETGIDRSAFSKVRNAFIPDLMSMFSNFKWVFIDGVEADDIIGACVIDIVAREPDAMVRIFSSDGDFKQLQSFAPGRVDQWSPQLNKLVVAHDIPGYDLELKILTGDTSDAIPNLVYGLGDGMADTIIKHGALDWINGGVWKTAKRLKPRTRLGWRMGATIFSENQLSEFRASGLITESTSQRQLEELVLSGQLPEAELTDEIITNEMLKQYDLNRKLIDFRYIPNEIKCKIMEYMQAYQCTTLSPSWIMECMGNRHGSIAIVNDFLMTCGSMMVNMRGWLDG